MPRRKRSRPLVYLAGPYVVFQPATHRAMQRGVNQIADAIRPTLGPRPRMVAATRIMDRPTPEILSDGATIARRIIRLADRDENVGAMLLRDILWRLHDQVGDGTATGAVLFQSVFNGSIHYLESGGNAMRLDRTPEGADVPKAVADLERRLRRHDEAGAGSCPHAPMPS